MKRCSGLYVGNQEVEMNAVEITMSEINVECARRFEDSASDRHEHRD